jgi:carbamoyl-phosphate synthase large subunit
MVEVGAELVKLGFRLVATEGTARALKAAGIDAEIVTKLCDDPAGSVLERMHRGDIAMVINTPSGTMARVDEVRIRGEAIVRDIAIVTTESGARATLASIRHMMTHDWGVTALQDYLAQLGT